MAVSVQFTSTVGLQTELIRNVKLRSVSVVAAVDETPVTGGSTQLLGDDLGAVFSVSHNGSNGVITVSVQQSANNGSPDAYATVTNGVVDREGVIATSSEFDSAVVGSYYLFGVNPAAVTEPWLRVLATPDTDYDGSEITLSMLTGQLRSAK